MTLLISALLLSTTLWSLNQPQPDKSGGDKIVLEVSCFNPDDPDNSCWIKQPLGNIKATEYFLTHDENGNRVIEGVSEQSASGLVYPISIDPKEYPIIEWSWKIESVLPSGDMRTKKGDDFPARVYITYDFPSSELRFGDRVKYAALKVFTSFDVPLRSLSYVWANVVPVGTVLPNAFSDWVQLVAVQSGNEYAGVWKSERRNHLEDYRSAFDEKPRQITGVSIMTDSDNTGESARAFYGTITFRKNP
jgi:hypothetical protein